MRYYFRSITALFTFCGLTNFLFAQEVKISGELKKWHKITLVFDGPECDEGDSYNPFLNYRLDVTFSNGDIVYKVPGYFAADGVAAESSATAGNKWKVHFSPDEVGLWEYNVTFRKGPVIAVSHEDQAGESAGYMDGARGRFVVVESDKIGRDFRSSGRLEFVNQTYLRFAGTGEYFLKAGADAPENLLAYSDFDGDFKNDGIKDEFIKSWSPHIGDWKEGDPLWKGGKGKGLIGAVNYLSSKGMNAISFIPMNIEGDDQNVYPYISYDIHNRMDVSKLAQWEIIFEHAQRKGIFLHFKTSEAENQGLLDNGNLGVNRRLYYRELISRFGHHLALNWNIGEENGKWMEDHPTPWQTTTQRLACAGFFYEHDPYNHHIVVHNGQAFYDLMGPESRYTGLSIQTNREDFGNVHSDVLKWREMAKHAGIVWANAVDEPGDHRFSLVPDDVNPNHDNARENALWGALMAGAWGIEWYFGYENHNSDLTCEDWRTRENMWDQSRYALEFFNSNELPFWEMEPMDDLTATTSDYVFAKTGEVYVIYFKRGKKEQVQFSSPQGDYEFQWYNPRTGQYFEKFQIQAKTDKITLGLPPEDFEMDWVVLVKKA